MIPSETDEAARAPSRPEPHIELRSVGKRFGPVTALASVDLIVNHGSVHALVGENGAGKSTLGRIICGVHTPDTGRVFLDGVELELRSPRQALRSGIALINQEPTLVPQRTVLDNVFLGHKTGRFGLVGNLQERLRSFSSLTERAGFAVSPTSRVRDLSIADKQRVAVIRALACDAQLIVMDEPTSTLTSGETEQLLTLVRSLRASGKTIVYVSHSLPEVLSIADTVTVLRDGQVIHTRQASDESPASLVLAMLGRELLDAPPPRGTPRPDAPTLLKVRGLSRGIAFRDASLTVRAGEIVGLVGLVGSGRSELVRAILGADRAESGTIELEGRRVSFRSPREAWHAGIAYIPESRATEGLLLDRSLSENITLPHLRKRGLLGVAGGREEREHIRRLLADMDVRATGPGAKVRTLSGGNQQKALIARCLYRTPTVLVADEPTRGVDVGARRAIYQILAALARDGLGLLVISSETEEVLGLAERILVMREGEIVAEFEGATATEAQILHAALGVEAAA